MCEWQISHKMSPPKVNFGWIIVQLHQSGVRLKSRLRSLVIIKSMSPRCQFINQVNISVCIGRSWKASRHFSGQDLNLQLKTAINCPGCAKACQPVYLTVIQEWILDCAGGRYAQGLSWENTGFPCAWNNVDNYNKKERFVSVSGSEGETGSVSRSEVADPLEKSSWISEKTGVNGRRLYSAVIKWTFCSSPQSRCWVYVFYFYILGPRPVYILDTAGSI